MSRLSTGVWALLTLISTGMADAGQLGSPTEPARAAQNALRNAADRTVTVTIGPGRRVPSELGDAANPMPIDPNERVVIRNASGGAVWVRFLDDSGVALVNDTIAVPDGANTTLMATALSRLAGLDRLLTIVVVDPAAPTVVTGTMLFVLAQAASPEAQAQADEMQIRMAQTALPRTKVTGRDPAAPSATPEPPQTVLDVGPLEAPPSVRKKSRPLPLERIRHEGEPVGESLRLTTSGPAKVVTFKDDKGRLMIRNVTAATSPVVLYRDIAAWAGRDGDLEFTVETAQAGAGPTARWTGYLTVNVSPLQTGRVLVPIDLTGVSDWRFINPRTPARIGPLREGATAATLEFVNRVPGRTIKVTFPAIPAKEQEAFENAGFEVDCGRPTTCTPELVLQAASRRVDAQLLIRAYGGDEKEGLVEFRVAFFEGDVEPANASGYLSVVRRPYEPSFSTSWSAAGNAGFVRDADFAGFTMSDTDAPIINVATPFDDQARWHLTGSIRLSARPQLGTRANAEIDLIVKDKDFGVADAPVVTTQKARVNVFGFNGFSMSLGRYDFAAPSRAIAISESGEGISGRWRRVTVSHVVRPREKLDKGIIPVPEGARAVIAASPDLRDRWSTLAQAQFAPRWFRIEASGLTGRRKTLAGAEGKYFTWGGDLVAANGFWKRTPMEPSAPGSAKSVSPDTVPSVSKPGAVWRLNGGFYSSYREAKASAVDATRGDRGWAGLVDGSVAWLRGFTPRVTVGATMAMASRDDTTTSQNEGYAGESSAFVPDRIFLATLAGKVAPLTSIGPDGEEQRRLLTGGLTGKKYAGTGFVYQGFSPLEWVARGLGVPASDMTTRSITVRWHGYSLRNPVVTTAGDAARSWLGQETSMEWLLESPRGVRYTLTGAYFAPGELLKAQRLILSSTWYVDARVTVTLK